MSRTHYQIYKEQTFVLARTLIVKHEEIASSMNDELYYRGYEMDSNPYNWRYYLNLNGEYHQADKDELYSRYGTSYIMVKVPSVFGYREIPFTKEVLHGATSDQTLVNEYYIGSKLFKELVSQYPDFETLIIGILNPIDIDVAINAHNGEILYLAGRYKRVEGDDSWYDTSPYGGNTTLIEEQEDNIIFELQKYINIFLRQWNNTEYAIGNDLYVVTMLGILYSNIPNVILNIRLGNCKTPRAHTFHIKQYLESFGQIGRYVDFIPISTSLWLYRNVHYLEANTGKMRTFDMLVDNTLTPNSVPIAAYTARHELSSMSDKQPLPTGMFYKEKINDVQVLGISDDDRTVMDILKDQRRLARDNDKDLLIKEDRIQTAVDWMGDDRINTKVLESEMAEIGDPYPFTLEQILFNTWGYSAIKGYYTGSVFVNNPISGDRLSFTALDAYILVQYCLNKAVAGVTLVNIPTVKLYNIPRTTNPGDKPTDPDYALKPSVDTMMGWCVKDVTRRRKVVELSGSMVPNFYSKDSLEFFSNAEDIYHERIRQYNLYCDIENLEERGDLELLAKRLQWMGFEESLSTLTYKGWFKTVGFNPDDYTTDDLLGLGLEIVSAATGISAQPSTSSTKWLQKSLMAILRHFLSYSVHIIEKHSDSAMAHLEGQTLRFTNLKWNYIGQLEFKYRLNLSYRTKNTIKINNRFDISNIFENTKVSINTSSEVSYDLSTLAYGQTKHKLDVGTYQLGVGLFGLSIKETAPVIIDIIVGDDEYNTILPTGIYAGVEDADVLPITLEGYECIDITVVSGSVIDTISTQPAIWSSDAIMISDITVVYDDEWIDRHGSSSEIIEVLNVYGYLNDESTVKLGISDSYIDTTYMDISASDDEVVVAISEYNVTSLILGTITGSVTNPAILIAAVDVSELNTDTMSIRLSDPQIPSIEVSDVANSMDIVNVVGRNEHVGFEIMASDKSSVTVKDMQATVIDGAVDPISTKTTDTLDISHISAGILDVSTVTLVSDTESLSVSAMSAALTDDARVTGTRADIMSVKISKMVVDSRVQASIKDKSSLVIKSMTAKVSDDTRRYHLEDSRGLIVNPIAIEGSMISMPTPLELTDEARYVIDTTGINISVFEYPLEYTVIENSTVALIDIKILADEPEVNLPYLQDSVYTNLMIRHMTGQSVDVNPDMVGRDSNGISLSTIHGGIVDEQVSISQTDDIDVRLTDDATGMIQDAVVTLAQMEGIFIGYNDIEIHIYDQISNIEVSDTTATESYNTHATLIDASVDTLIQVQSHSVTTDLSTVAFIIHDSDIMRTTADLHRFNINIEELSITIVDDNATQNP